MSDNADGSECYGCGHEINLHGHDGCKVCGCMDWECEELEEGDVRSSDQ